VAYVTGNPPGPTHASLPVTLPGVYLEAPVANGLFSKRAIASVETGGTPLFVTGNSIQGIIIMTLAWQEHALC